MGITDRNVRNNLGDIGVCVKAIDTTVEEQNPLCEKICGNQIGSRCQKGCILQLQQSKVNEVFDRGFHHFRNMTVDNKLVDALVINDGKKLTTLLYDINPDMQKKLELLKKFHLSNAETQIIEQYLRGTPSHDIAKNLFISKTTLRTHLNNIYKKIPLSLKEEILSSHLGKKTKDKCG